MTLEEVKEIITNSKFNPDLKQRMVLFLPRLGKNSLESLGKEVSRGDSVIIAEYLTSLWESFANFLDGLKNKDQNALRDLSEFFAKRLSRFNDEDEFYTLGFVLDVRAIGRRAQTQLSAEQNKKLLDFEIRMFWDLPKEEVLYLLRNNILYLLEKINLLEYTRAAIYKNNWDEGDTFNQLFLDALLQNKEMLGSGESKPVGVWIKDFLSFSVPTHSQASTFGVAEFLLRGPSIKELSKIEKEGLAEILNLFVWLTEPIIVVDEVRKFIEKTKEAQSEEVTPSSFQNTQRFTLPPELLNASKPIVKPAAPPLVPAPGNQPVAKKVQMGEISQPQQMVQPERPTKTTVNYITQKPTQNQQPTKAEKYLQQEIDRKLHKLEEKTKGSKK